MFGRVTLLVLLACPAAAAERAFGYTYESETLAPEQKEAGVDLAYRFLRAHDYSRVDARAGFGFGVSRIFEAQLLLDFSIATPGSGDPQVIGLITGLIQARILDPHADALGLAVRASVSGGPTNGFLELRLVLDKWVGNLLLAVNALASQSFGPDAATRRLEQTAALAYRLPNHFSAGIELRNRLAYDDASRFLGDAVYVGPTLSVRGKTFWAAVSLLGQVAAVKARSQVGNGEPNEVLDNERFNFRLALGFDVD